jgi:putative ABC transport system permease protein
MWKYVPFAYKNALRNKRRTALTILSVGGSLFLLATLIAIYAAFYHREETPEQALRLITRHRVSLTFSLPEYYAARVAQIPGVRMVARESWFGGVYIDHKSEHRFARFAADADKIFALRPEWKVNPEQRAAFERERTAAAVGRTIAEPLGLRIGQKIVLQGDIYPGNHELTIRAIFEGPDDNLLYMHRDYLEETLPQRRRGQTGFLTIMAESPEAVPRIAAAVDEMFRNSPQQTKTESERAFNLSFVSMIGNVKLIIFSISAAVMFAILLVAANTMAMSARERIAEVGVLKTLGFTPGKVVALIVGEAVILSLAAGVIGNALAAWMVAVIGKMPVFFIQGMKLPPAAVAITLGVGVLVGVASSLVPALSAARMPIPEALRHTG